MKKCTFATILSFFFNEKDSSWLKKTKHKMEKMTLQRALTRGVLMASVFAGCLLCSGCAAYMDAFSKSLMGTPSSNSGQNNGVDPNNSK